MTLHRRRARGLLVLLAVALTLGACSSGEEPSPTQSPAPTASSASEAEQPTGAPSEPSSKTSAAEMQQPQGPTTPAASGERVSQEQIQAAIDAFVKKHEGAQQIPGSEIDPGELADDSEDMKIEPQQCRDFYHDLQDGDLPEGGRTHVAIHRNTGLGNVVWLSIQEYQTAEDARQMAIDRGEPVPHQCNEAKTETNGVMMTLHYTQLEAPTFDNVDMTSAMHMVQTIPGGASTTTNSVSALKGNVVVSSSLHSVDGSLTPQEAVAIVRDALEAMEQ
ncbi:hypothetical protein [uncultured Tessaracoccus sp.]|uniref:hypothetical protein n=1 Tax=uncultured Tessaracoccus sp. TaxID=905023 RepID=UPI002605840A|nr:hypothetical protein [uncultured Tessaracoccus sp.]